MEHFGADFSIVSSSGEKITLRSGGFFLSL
jgi:hypothetical protein